MKIIRAPLFGFVATLLLLIISCSLEMPGIPKWVIQGTLPFSDRVYKMGELITDSARMAERGWGITLDSRDSVLLFELRDTIEYQSIGDRITYEASSVESFNNTIDTVHINEPRTESDTINISEANPSLGGGYHGVVGPFVMQQVQDVLEFDKFRWVNVCGGWMYITATNGFPFPIDNLIVQFRNFSGGNLIGTAQFMQRIMPGQTVVDSIPLVDKYVQNQILMTADATSPGTADAITITGRENLIILIRMSALDVESADAHIPSQTFHHSDELTYNNRNKIITTEIKSGNVYFTMQNTSRLRLYTEMRFMNIFDSSGNFLIKNFTLEPEQSSQLITLDLSGCTIRMTLDDQRLLVENTIIIEDSDSTRYMGSSFQVVAGWQGVNVTYWTDEMVLKRFEGALDSVSVDIPEYMTAIKLPKGLDSINFTRDTIFLSIENQSTMLMKLNLEISARNSQNGRTHSIPLSEDINPGLNTFAIPNSDQLLAVIPDTIKITGEAGLGRYYFPQFGYRVGTIEDSDGVAGNLLIRTPLKFTIGTTTLTTDLTHLKEPIDLDIERVELRVHIKNSIPLSGAVKLLMGNDSLAMDTVANVVIPRQPILNRRVIGLADTAYTLQMPTSSIEKMRLEPLYTQQIIQLFSNQGDTAWIYPEDSLVVQASATLFYKLDFGEED